MSLFDLLFIVCFLASVVTLLSVVILALRGRFAHSLALLKRWTLCALVYFAIVIVSSIFWTRTVLQPGEPRCFDDWCIAVDGATHQPSAAGDTCTVELRVFSRARRVSQRELNVIVYLTDDRGNRYDPEALPSDVPFSTFLGPEQSVPLTRRFTLPAGARNPALVITHSGGFPIGWFIIGYETWFHPPTLVRLP
jgi:hypothetical protein